MNMMPFIDPTLILTAQRIYGADTAGQFINLYRNIQVPELAVIDGEIRQSGEQISTSALAYVNNGAKVDSTSPTGPTPGKRAGFRSLLLSLKKNKTLAKYVSFTEGEEGAVSVSNSRGILFDYTRTAVFQSFYGKGTPGQITKTVNLMNLWRVFMLDIRKREQSAAREVTDKLTKAAAERENAKSVTYDHQFQVDDLPTMVEQYLGVDCNGFANLYLKNKYPNLEIKSANTMEDLYVQTTGKKGDKQRIKENLRHSLADVKQDDAVVFYKGHYHHIAIINVVLVRSADGILVSLAESRGKSKGGVQVNNFWIRQKKKGGKPVSGEFTIDGRASEDFVNIVSPDRWRPA